MRWLIITLAACGPLLAAAPAQACTRLTRISPATPSVPANAWIWVESLDDDDGFWLEREGRRIDLSVRESAGRFFALTPDEPVMPGETYGLFAPSDPEGFPDAAVTFTDAVDDDAPPALTLGAAGFVLLEELIDTCATGSGGSSTLYVCADLADGTLTEKRLVNAEGEVLARRINRGRVAFSRIADDAEGLAVEIRGVGPRGARGPWTTLEVATLEGYVTTSSSAGGLACDGELTLDGTALSESDAARPYRAGGCAAAPGAAATGLVPLLGALVWARRRRG